MKKFLIGSVIVLGLIAAVTPSAQAATVAELEALIASLQSQIAALSNVTTSSASFTRDLTVGSTGADVVALQNFLEARGQLVMPAGVAKGYFGPITRSALASYQAANGITPAVGYFGPITRAKVSPVVTTPGTTPTTPTTPVITTPGAEGSLTVTERAIPGNQTLKAGETKTVLAYDVKATGSDININRLDVTLTTASSRPWFAFDKIEVVDGSSVIASVNASSAAFEEITVGSEYRLRLSGLNVVVPKNSTKTLSVRVTLPSSLSISAPGSVTVKSLSDSIRYVDGAGISQTEGKAFSRIVTIESASIGTVEISAATSNPKARNVFVNETSVSSETDLLVFDVKAKNSDVAVKKFTFTLSTSTIESVTLYEGSSPLKTVSASTTGTIFENITVSVPKDTTKTFRLAAKFVAQENNYAAGALASTTLVSISAEDAQFRNVVSGVTPNLVGSAVYRYIAAPVISAISVSEKLNTVDGKTSSFDGTITFTLTAKGGDIVINPSQITAAASNASTTASAIYVEVDGKTSGDVTISNNQPVKVVVKGLISPGAGVSTGESHRSRLTVSVLGWTGGSIPTALLEDLRTDNVLITK